MSPGKKTPCFKKRRFAAALFWRLFLACLFLLLIAWTWHSLAQTGMNYEWQWNRVWRHVGGFGPDGFTPGPLCEGALLTIAIAFAGALFTIIIGFFACVLRLSPWPACVWLSLIYVALWRNTPLLLQLFFAYFLISPLLNLTPFWTAVLALAAFEGAYLGEIFRAGVLSVQITQWEASLALGFNLRQTFALVILPQALRNMTPALTNQAISLLKDTSLVSAIAVADLTMRSQAIVAETFLAFEVWLLAGAIYLAMALCVSLPGLWLERHKKWS